MLPNVNGTGNFNLSQALAENRKGGIVSSNSLYEASTIALILKTHRKSMRKEIYRPVLHM